MMKTVVLASLAGLAKGDERCCASCPEGEQKYYSVDMKHGHCGEACIKPSSFSVFKIFEPNLTIADGSTGYTSCAELGWPRYTETVTHGDPLQVLTCTLDLYDHNAANSNPKPGSGSEPGPAEFLQMIEGLAHGIFNDDTLSSCIDSVAATLPSVAGPIADLVAALESKNAFKIAVAVAKLKAALAGVPDELAACGANIQDVKDFYDVVEQVLPPILEELSRAKESLDHHNYEDFGLHLGRAIKRLISHGPHGPGPIHRLLHGPGPHGPHGPGGGPGDDPEPKPGPKPGPNPGPNPGPGDDPEPKPDPGPGPGPGPGPNPGPKDALDVLVGLAEGLLDDHNFKRVVENLEGALSSLKAERYYDFGNYVGKALADIVYGDHPHTADIVV